MEIDPKTLGAIIGGALLLLGAGGGGGAWLTTSGQQTGAENACDGVVEQFLNQLSEQREACDARVKACWEHRTRYNSEQPTD